MKKVLSCEIISVGTEMLLGTIVNSDARDISAMLATIGLNVHYHTVVGDNPDRLRQCVQTARSRVDVIITTGGLGPTCDDLTKQILSDAFGLKLVCDQFELRRLSRFEPEDLDPALGNNYVQAMLPEGCTVFHNQWGIAPGCAFVADGKIVIMVPGPPTECTNMFRACALPFLSAYTDEVIVSHTVNVVGISESAMADMFSDEMDSMVNPTMAPYAKGGVCFIRVTAKAHSPAEAERMLEPLIRHVSAKLGDHVYGIDASTLEGAVLGLLEAMPEAKSLSIADGCSGGGVFKRFTDLSGSDRFFKGGVAYGEGRAEAADQREALSLTRKVCLEMGADIGLGMFRLSRDLCQSDGTVAFVAVVSRDGELVERVEYNSNFTRRYVRHNIGNCAFDLLRRYLSKSAPD